MRKRKLTDIPEHILVKPANISSGSKWQSDYNVAAWFRFKQQSNDLIRLHLFWLDDSGEQHLCVDQTKINSSSILLSGIARLKITGPIRSMSVAVESASEDYSVDELFVQPTRTTQATKQA